MFDDDGLDSDSEVECEGVAGVNSAADGEGGGARRRGVGDGDIPATVDVHALARFIQSVQNGMSVLARDGVTRAELESIAEIAMMGWDPRVGR